MTLVFYIPALVALLTTLAVVLNTRPVHALLNLIVSFIAIAMMFFALGAPFAGALEIIIYAGAIMVMFAFVMMMLNLGKRTEEQEKKWLSPGIWWFPSSMAALLFIALAYTLFRQGNVTALMGESTHPPEQVGMLLFGPYIILVELAAFLLLAALIVASHIGKPSDTKEGDAS